MTRTCYGQSVGKQNHKILYKDQPDTNMIDHIFTFVLFPRNLHYSCFYIMIKKVNKVKGMPTGNRSELRVVNFLIQFATLLTTEWLSNQLLKVGKFSLTPHHSIFHIV